MRLIDADVLKQHIDKLPALPDGNFAGNHSALKALIKMPWWCTGFSCSTNEYATIVCYLPEGEPFYKYWDDAFDIEAENVSEIKYSDRFPKPEWCE